MLAAIVSVDPFGHRLQPGPNAGFVVLAAFLLSYLAIRTSARLTRAVSWWPGGVRAGGVHLHHFLWGIALMLICGFLGFAAPLESPWWHLVAIGFGVGAGFTLDEFALLVWLDDVYWSDEGRLSFDAVVCACLFAALVVLGTQPFGLDEPTSVVGTALTAATVLALACTCFAKGKSVLGVAGLFIPLFAVVGAVRLARPSSPWARWRYSEHERLRAEQRFAPHSRLARARRRLADLVAGAPADGR